MRRPGVAAAAEPEAKPKKKRGEKKTMRVKRSACLAAVFIRMVSKASAFMSAVCTTLPQGGLRCEADNTYMPSFQHACPAIPPACALAGCVLPAVPGTLTDGYVARCRWVDTGCPCDSIRASEPQACDKVRKADEGGNLATANGEVCIDEVVDMQIGPFGEISSPHVM